MKRGYAIYVDKYANKKWLQVPIKDFVKHKKLIAWIAMPEKVVGSEISFTTEDSYVDKECVYLSYGSGIPLSFLMDNKIKTDDIETYDRSMLGYDSKKVPLLSAILVDEAKKATENEIMEMLEFEIFGKEDRLDILEKVRVRTDRLLKWLPKKV